MSRTSLVGVLHQQPSTTHELLAMTEALGGGPWNFAVGGPDGTLCESVGRPSPDSGLFALAWKSSSTDTHNPLATSWGGSPSCSGAFSLVLGAHPPVQREVAPADPRSLQALGGPFVSVHWGGTGGTLVLAVSPFGQRSLVTTEFEGGLAFSTELPALWALPQVDRSVLSVPALGQFFRFGHLVAPETPFANIRRIAAGTMERWDDGEQSTEVWWQPRVCPASSDPTELDSRLDQAVAETLPEQGSVGVLLTGGVDSGLIAASAVSVAGDRVRLVGIPRGQAEAADDRRAEAVAAHLGRPLERPDGLPDIETALGAIQAQVGEPLAFGRAGLSLLAQLQLVADDGGLVALTGDGADDLFAGDDRFGTSPRSELAGRTPRWVRRVVLETGRRIGRPFDSRWSDLLLSASSLDLRGREHPWFFHSHWGDLCFQPQFAQALQPSHWEDPFARFFTEANARNPADRLLEVAQRLHLPSYVLRRTHAAAQEAGAELRTPFLNRNFVEWANALPDSARRADGLRRPEPGADGPLLAHRLQEAVERRLRGRRRQQHRREGGERRHGWKTNTLTR